MSLLRYNFPHLPAGLGKSIDFNDTGPMVFRGWNHTRYIASDAVAIVFWCYENSHVNFRRICSTDSTNGFEFELRSTGGRHQINRMRGTASSEWTTLEVDIIPSSATWYFQAFLDRGMNKTPQHWRGTETALATEVGGYATQQAGTNAPVATEATRAICIGGRRTTDTTGWNGALAFFGIYDAQGWTGEHLRALQQDHNLFHDRAIFKTYLGDMGAQRAIDLVSGVHGFSNGSSVIDPGPTTLRASRSMLVPTTRKIGFVAAAGGGAHPVNPLRHPLAGPFGGPI